MQVKALKTFAGKYGPIRTGMIVTVDERYGRALLGRNLVVAVGAQTSDPGLLEPERNTDLGGAPETKGDAGNDDVGDDPSEAQPEDSSHNQDTGSEIDSSEDPPTAGWGRRSSSPRAGRRSRKKT